MEPSQAVEWRPVQRQRTHEQVLAQVEEQILQGQLRPGDRLPAERQLAEVLGVSRSAVREALRVLESMGVVTAGTGSGPASGSVIVGKGSPALANLLRLHLALSSFSRHEVMQVRVLLERGAVAEAAARVDGQDLSGLRRIVATMGDHVHDGQEYNQLDTAFHVGLAEASGNSLLSTTMQAIRDAVHREMVAVFAELDDAESVMRRLTSEHAAILDAVEDGDGDRAARLVQEHIEGFYAGPAAEAAGGR